MAAAHRRGALVASLAAVALLCAATLTQPAGAADSEACRALGFTGSNLCSDCDTLASYVKDDELVADCRQCCTRGKAGGEQKYTSAVLKAWLERLGTFPHIEGFVKNEADKFAPALKVRDAYATSPHLVLSAPGVPKKIVRIEGWKTEHVVQFLEETLEPAAEEAATSKPVAGGGGSNGVAAGRAPRHRERLAEE